MKNKKQKEQPEYVELDIDFISGEITDYLIEKNLLILGHERKEEYEKCGVLHEQLMIFISETCATLNQATSIKYQKLYLHFHQQNSYLHEMIRKKF